MIYKMRNKKSKAIWIILLLGLFFLPNNNLYASDLEVDWFNIIPELTWWQIDKIDKAIEEIWATWWNVWKKYNENADKLSTSEQIGSGIMNRNTIMNYLVFIVQFLSQLWLVVWAIFIMYAWYKYMTSIFAGWKTPSSTVKNAIIGVIIVIFSYAIMRVLTSFIWLT